MSNTDSSLLRSIPSVDALLNDAAVQAEAGGLGRAVLVDAVRQAVQQLRDTLTSAGTSTPDKTDLDADSLRAMILQFVREALAPMAKPHYRSVINATGIILHTALGRAVLCEKAIDQVNAEMRGYSMLQIDAETGARSKRDERIEWLLKKLTGADAATVVNNNAAATMIVLNTLGAGREVIVSRGHLVEIGGSFRLPDVMAASGATMVEVGTTNKTHARDYENAITENTAAILRVHPSNYKVVGFSAEVSLDDMVDVAHRNDLPLIDDVGAGALIDFKRFGFDDQQTLGESIRAGADIITASGDKLIGGAQSGIILGRKELVDRVRKNPLARVMRVGKLTLAVLEATLSVFLDEVEALRELPTLRMLQRTIDDLDSSAQRMAASLRGAVEAEVEVIDGESQMGSGSLPGENLPTKLLALRSTSMNATELSRRLRLSEPPIFARISQQQVLIDPRTLLDGQELVIVEAVKQILTTTA